MSRIFKARVLQEFGDPLTSLYSPGDVIYLTPCTESYAQGYYWISTSEVFPDKPFEAVSPELVEIVDELQKSA